MSAIDDPKTRLVRIRVAAFRLTYCLVPSERERNASQTLFYFVCVRFRLSPRPAIPDTALEKGRELNSSGSRHYSHCGSLSVESRLIEAAQICADASGRGGP